MLRERCDLTGKELASDLKIPASNVTRWEQGDMTVPMERRPALLTKLGALPEEADALSLGNPPVPPLSGADLDACAAALDALEQRLGVPPPGSGGRPVTNLDFLVLQQALWRNALTTAAALELFRRALALHSGWLDSQDRRKEMSGPVDRLFALMKGVELAHLPESQDWWVLAVLHRVRVLRFAYPNRSASWWNPASVHLLEKYLMVARGVQRCTIHRDIAWVLTNMREFGTARAHIEDAKALATRHDEAGWSSLWCAKIEADIWVEEGNPERALEIAPPVEKAQPLPEQQAHLYVLWADLLQRVGSRREAENYLDAGRALMQGKFGPSHLLRNLDAIADRLG